jgi:hypothetical protein
MHADLFGAARRIEELKDEWFTGAFVAPWLRIWDSPLGQTCIWAFEPETEGGHWRAVFSPAGPYQGIAAGHGDTREAAALALIETTEREFS